MNDSTKEYTPTESDVRRVYVLAPNNLRDQGKKEWSAQTESQFDRWINAHDVEVRAKALADAEAELIRAAPPLNAELSMRGSEGPFTDSRMEAYTEGFHDAYTAVRALTLGPPTVEATDANLEMSF